MTIYVWQGLYLCEWAALQLGTKSPRYKTIRYPDKGRGSYAVKSFLKKLALVHRQMFLQLN